MLQTRDDAKKYKAKHMINSKVEWLIEHGKKNQVVFFKGETGDRYTIYVFNKRNKNTVDIYTIYNTWSHDTELGDYVATIKDYKLNLTGLKSWDTWRNSGGELVKQLMRQGICPLSKYFYKIRYCRSAYFMKTHDGNEFTPWLGMKLDLKTGLLVNKPNRDSVKDYKKAKNQDKVQRKAHYIANRENTRALERYRKAGGDTELARGGWRNGRWNTVVEGAGTENINWDMIPLDDVFRHRNATLRSNIIEHFGMNAILATLDHEVVAEDTIDGRYYKLLDVTIPDFSNSNSDLDKYKGLFLEMINPSTGESHFEGVPNYNPTNNWGDRLPELTIKAALAWRDNDREIANGNSWQSSTSKGYIKPVTLT